MTEEAKRETEVPVLTKIQMELKVPKYKITELYE